MAVSTLRIEHEARERVRSPEIAEQDTGHTWLEQGELESGSELELESELESELELELELKLEFELELELELGS